MQQFILHLTILPYWLQKVWNTPVCSYTRIIHQTAAVAVQVALAILPLLPVAILGLAITNWRWYHSPLAISLLQTSVVTQHPITKHCLYHPAYDAHQFQKPEMEVMVQMKLSTLQQPAPQPFESPVFRDRWRRNGRNERQDIILSPR